ncbi:nuclear transport factor 2 family protein [Parasphingorhabdus sp. JC815]|uniref:nuclear transport factor 2 family protein n=1 Tax=Parasphingorhabdus sp. JC815 TaxID=3232140 RepID=UPI0034585BBB
MSESASAADKIKAVETYIASFADSNPQGIISIFADDATVEDPVGTPILTGRDSLRTFFSKAVKMGTRLKLLGPIRCADDYAAFPFAVELNLDGSDKRIEVIDLFKFNEQGKVIQMQAFWGPENMQDI